MKGIKIDPWSESPALDIAERPGLDSRIGSGGFVPWFACAAAPAVPSVRAGMYDDDGDDDSDLDSDDSYDDEEGSDLDDDGFFDDEDDEIEGDEDEDEAFFSDAARQRACPAPCKSPAFQASPKDRHDAPSSCCSPPRCRRRFL